MYLFRLNSFYRVSPAHPRIAAESGKSPRRPGAIGLIVLPHGYRTTRAGAPDTLNFSVAAVSMFMRCMARALAVWLSPSASLLYAAFSHPLPENKALIARRLPIA